MTPCAELFQLCLTLCDSMDCNLPGSSVDGILQARIVEWTARPSSLNDTTSGHKRGISDELIVAFGARLPRESRRNGMRRIKGRCFTHVRFKEINFII